MMRRYKGTKFFGCKLAYHSDVTLTCGDWTDNGNPSAPQCDSKITQFLVNLLGLRDRARHFFA
jgi:hypothetical protein